jgi:hypothetical protein
MDEASQVKEGALARYDIQFDLTGVTFRFPPEFYAPDWSQIEDIKIQYRDAKAESGRLELRVHNTNGRRFTEVVGNVERSCWVTVKEYIHKNIFNRGIAVHMIETIVP